MKHTLVERVAKRLYGNIVRKPWKESTGYTREVMRYEARRIIAMVRRHDSRKGAKK